MILLAYLFHTYLVLFPPRSSWPSAPWPSFQQRTGETNHWTSALTCFNMFNLNYQHTISHSHSHSHTIITIPRKKIWFEARAGGFIARNMGDSTGIPLGSRAAPRRPRSGPKMASCSPRLGLGLGPKMLCLVLFSGENDDEPWDLLKHLKQSKHI